jgi:formylglycine-generating enzyme required for sulfatase activity
MGKTEKVWPLLRHSADPRLRSFIINWLSPLGTDARILGVELEKINPHANPIPDRVRKPMEAVLFDPGTSPRRALILALGTYGSEMLSRAERDPLMATLLNLYRNDADAGIHGAAEWTLRKWGQGEKLRALDLELAGLKDRDGRRWFVNADGQTFSLINGPVEFGMSSPTTETERLAGNEPLRRMVIPRRFAIATTEVSVAQFQRFLKQAGLTNPRYTASTEFLNKSSPDPDGPWITPDWYTAAHYCNWLSEQERLPREQWCYIPAKSGAYDEGMTIPADVLVRTGYRLPTDAEWEYACRSGAATARYYGVSIDLLDAYARYRVNSQEHAWPSAGLLPNDLGLFDMLGNVYEWCQDLYRLTEQLEEGGSIDRITVSEVVSDRGHRARRGGA